MKARVLALLLALAWAAPAGAEDDLAADFGRLQSRIAAAQSEMIARREQMALLEAGARKPAGVFSGERQCGLFRSGLRGGGEASARQAEAERLLDGMVARLVEANGLAIPSLCRSVLAPDREINASAEDQTAVVEPDDEGLAQLDQEQNASKGVVATSGLIAVLGDDSELAGVLGHELAHLALHYTRDVMTDALAAQRLGLATERSTFAKADQHALDNWLAGQQQVEELEADRLGAVFMARAGYDPDGMSRLLEALARFDRPSMDHPSIKTRETLLAAELPEVRRIRRKAEPVRALDRVKALLD